MFDPTYFSIADGNLGTINTVAFPREVKYMTLDSINTVSSTGYFPASTGLRLRDIVTIWQVDNLDPNSGVIIAVGSVVVTGL